MDTGKYVKEFQDTYVVVDIETTGLSPMSCEIIEIGAIKVLRNEIIERFQVLLKPSAPISSFITKLTGITNEMVEADGLDPIDAFAQFLAFTGDSIILGHNVSFDLGFLRHHILESVGVIVTNDYADTCRIARKLLKGRVANCKLGTLTTYFGFDYSGAHRAMADCEFTYQVYNALLEVSCGFR